MEKNSIFTQRQIEALILKQVTDGLSVQFRKEEILDNLRVTIEKIAFENGKILKDKNPKQLLTLAKHWKKLAEGGSLETNQMECTDSQLTFRVTYCKYAEFYKEIGATELGMILSCCRDSPFLEGFSYNIKMKRSKTILEGNSSCDFIYELKNSEDK